MNQNYRSCRLLLVNVSYFYALQLLLTHNFFPGVPQGIEYLAWLGIAFLIFLFAWLITDVRRVEVSAALWLMALFFMLWVDLHRQHLAEVSSKKILLILAPSLIVMVSFLLWSLGMILDRLPRLKQEMLYSVQLVFPLWILLFRQKLLPQIIEPDSSFALMVFFAMVIISTLLIGLLLSFLSSLRVFPLSRIWLMLVLPVAFFALFGLVRAQIQQKRLLANVDPTLPDLILISVDTLRWDHLGIFSNQKIPTPNFDRLAQDTVIFENAISPSNWTLPAIASWLTGKYPDQHQAGKLIWEPAINYLSFTAIDPQMLTLAQQLKKKGYYTAAFLDNAWLRNEFGFAKGFDYYFLGSPPQLHQDLMGIKLVKAIYYLATHKYQEPDGGWLTARVINWLKKNRAKKPLFLWVHYFDPHLPYLAHPEYPISLKANSGVVKIISRTSSPELIRSGYHNLSRTDQEFIHQCYLGEIIYTDKHFGRLMQALKDENRYLDSVIIFTSDHGEEFWDHNGFEHGHSFYQELIQVPLLVKLPQNQNAGQKISAVVSTAQIYPTMLEFARIQPTTSLSSLLKVQQDPAKAPEVVISEFPFYFDLKGAVINQEFKKLILGSQDEKFFFDLTSDPEEKNPLPVEQIPPTLLTIELPSPTPARGKVKMSQETRRNLEALGYLK